MADLQPVGVPLSGGVIAGTAAAAASVGGDTAPVGPNRLLYVDNAGAASITATVITPGKVRGLDIADATLTVPAGDTGLLPLPRDLAGPDGRASITYDDVTSVSVAVLELES